MRIGSAGKGSGQACTPREDTPAAEPAPQSRALTVVAQPVERAHAPPPALPRQSAFLAHLIATQAQFPQTRARRRAEPQEAIAAYRAAADLVGG
ncbi:MAG: hypothetical protein ACK4UO_02565 [Pseudolabrys sp.]